MSVLVIADIINDKLSFDQTGKTVSAVLGLGDITVLCACRNADTASKEAAKFDGVSKVLSASHENFTNGLAESMADLIISQAEHYEYVVSAATAHGKNILPRVAALLDVMIITDISKVLSKDTFERPIYAGNALQVVKSTDSKKIISVRTANFEVPPQNNSCKIETITDVSIKNDSSQWVEDKIQDNDRPELTSAKVIVSGGRGLGSEENFEIIEKLAVKLGAAVGASRAAVDSGYAPNDWQVGQTGKVVAPELYIAVGISGAIQHLAGMKDSKVIVAINKDEEAPIFQVADYGLVGDLFKIVPDLANKL
jgi:electron transfer flavoprotein alpha subunit